ncbi:MAG: hypothetical protein KF727_02510 [Microbacteriaceae bacterium]|nr:hypothetical protein [Microbacteriaceae bacterium]
MHPLRSTGERGVEPGFGPPSISHEAVARRHRELAQGGVQHEHERVVLGGEPLVRAQPPARLVEPMDAHAAGLPEPPALVDG